MKKIINPNLKQKILKQTGILIIILNTYLVLQLIYRLISTIYNNQAIFDLSLSDKTTTFYAMYAMIPLLIIILNIILGYFIIKGKEWAVIIASLFLVISLYSKLHLFFFITIIFSTGATELFIIEKLIQGIIEIFILVSLIRTFFIK
jgi:hypothetical protein